MELSEKDIARFWSKVNKNAPNGCWEWTGCRTPLGYGQFRAAPRFWIASRFSYTISKGEIPKGLHVLHHCDNPPCVNPDHLWLGTDKDNHADAQRKGRLRGGKGLRAGVHTHPEKRPFGDRNGARTHPERVVRGEQRPFAKLKTADILQIRALAESGMQYKDIAPRFGVSDRQISRIVHRLVWRHVP